MSDNLIRISGGGYYDWERGISLPPEDYKPAPLPKIKPSLPARAAREAGEIMLALASGLLGCGTVPGGPICEKDTYPAIWPTTSGAKPHSPDQPDEVLKIHDSALDTGVPVLWKFPVANCDRKMTNLKVAVEFPDQGTVFFSPDENGLITVTATLTRKNQGDLAYYPADLYYWDPVNNTAPQPLRFPLWLPEIVNEVTQLTKCDYSPDPNSGGGFSVPSTADFNQSKRLLAWPRECDDKTDALSVNFMINGQYYAATRDGDSFYLDHTFDVTGSIPVAAYAQDTSRGSSVIQIENTTKSIYVKASDAAVDIYAKPGDDGPIALRPIAVQAGYVSQIPVNAVDFAWEIRDPDGVLLQLQGASNQNITFTPQREGVYTVKLTLNGQDFSSPIVKFGTIVVYPFSAPDLAISGDQNPSAGTSKNYKALLLPKDRQLGSEDETASCSWKLFHIDPTTNQPVPDMGPTVQNCSNNSLTVTFPNTMLSQTAYTLQLDVTGGSDAYKVRKYLPITAYPASAQMPKADFTVGYADQAIPFRDINFNGLLINGSEAAVYNYNWTITDNQGNPVTTMTSQNPNASYQFNRSGIYNVKLEIVPDGATDPLATISQSLVIYPFPIPNLEISVNDNFVVYSHQEVPLFAYLNMNRPEDQSATYAWKVTHKGLNPATNQYEDIVDLDPSQPAAQSLMLLYNFNESKTYSVTQTVTGMHGASVAYVKTTTKLVDVYNSFNGLPAATISSNLKYSYHQGDTANGVSGNSDDPNAAYKWTVIDPDGQVLNFPNQALPAFPFNKTGNYFFKLEVTGSDGVTKNFAYRSVDVYPASSFIPSVGISGPYSAHTGDRVNLTGNSDDPNATYSWTITPPSGPIQTVNSRSLSNFQLNMLGDWDFKLTVTAADGSTQNAKIHPISVYPPITAIPSSVISSNLKYSYHVGDTENNISGYSDDPAATYRWIITKPDSTIQTIIGKTITNFTFALPGDYDFKLEVTAADGVTKNTELRSVSVYPLAVQTPQAGIIAPFAGKVGQPVNFVAANPNNGLYTYNWAYGDGTTGIGSVPSPKTFAQAGTYTVMLTVARQDDPTIKDVVTQKITIVPVAIDPPALSMTAPYSAKVNTPVAVAVASPDSANWNYSWNFGDGSGVQNGTAASRTYTNQGTYTIELTATSKADANVKYIITQSIAIVPSSITPPSFKLTVPYAAEEGTIVPMSMANVDPGQWDISWNFGDGGTAVGANTNHTYASSGKYQILCTLTSKVDPNTQIVTPFVITVIPHGDPVPNLVLTPGLGQAPLNVTANAGTSYATASGASITNYKFNWGDGSAEENGGAASRNHIYSCSNASCGYTVRMTVTDSNGKTSNITATVSTWQ